jgi:putative transposase
MPKYRRIFIPGQQYFFTVNLANRRSSLLVDHIDLFRQSYSSVLKTHPVETLAICILPNHLHCLWQMPETDSNYSQRWRLIKGNFTRALRKTGVIHPNKKVWQNRYWEHHIRDDDDFNHHFDYIHANPVNHGYVDEIADWPYSSWHKLDREIKADLQVKAEWNHMKFGES